MSNSYFTLEDQSLFARLSGDNNPLHIDAIAARRTLFGAPLVHGVHGLLRALDYWLGDKSHKIELNFVKAVFNKPIKVGNAFDISIVNEDENDLLIHVESNGYIATIIKIKWAEATQDNGISVTTDFPRLIEPRVLSEDELESDSGDLNLSLNIEAANRLFPNLVKRLSSLQFATMLHTSRLVGVQCPGLHSLFSEIELSKAKLDGKTILRYTVEEFDRRFGLVTMKVSGPGMTGKIKAFLRPKPLQQDKFQILKNKVNNNEFANQRALIIGGSRGLGEVASKLLAGGGADVKITYHMGKEDAWNVVDDIVGNGGTADCFQYNVLEPSIDPNLVSNELWRPTHLYYFATPFIFAGTTGIFLPELLKTFCDYYVIGFVNLFYQLKDLGVKRVFYPSSVAIDEIPNNMGEYASAKIAGELLCDYLEKTNQGLIIYKPRFPRVATDQTVSIMPVKNEDPAIIMIKELRVFQSR